MVFFTMPGNHKRMDMAESSSITLVLFTWEMARQDGPTFQTK